MSGQRIVEALELTEISPAAKLAAIHIGDNASPEHEYIQLTKKRLAVFCCIQEFSVRRILEDLVYVGFLHRIHWVEESETVDCFFPWWYGPQAREPKKGAVSAEARAYVTARDKVCVYCGCDTGPYHIDHILPSSRGGTADVNNLALACAPCNIAKRNRTPEEWLKKTTRNVSLSAVNAIRGAQ